MSSQSTINLSISQATGIVRDERGIAFIPATQRPDGTWRKAQRVREGYIPEEDVKRYETSAARARRNAPVCPGYVPDPATASSKSSVPGYSSSQSSALDLPLSKGAKKNLKRKEQRKKKKDEQTKIDIEHQYADLLSGDKAVEELTSAMRRTKLNQTESNHELNNITNDSDALSKKIRNLKKKLRQIDELKEKIETGQLANPDPGQLEKVSKRDEISEQILKLEASLSYLNS